MINSEDLSQIFWQQVSHSTLAQFGTAEKTKEDVKALKRVLDPTDLILDLGCGWGRVTCVLAAEGYHVSGVDLSENLIIYAQKQATTLGLNIQFKIGSMFGIRYPDESFDKIVCLWGAFNHMLNPGDQISALNEMHRVLKPGGLAFIEFGNGESKRYRSLMAAQGYGHQNRVIHLQYNEDQPPNVVYIHDRGTLANIAGQSNFEKFRVKFQNINRKRRTVTYLFKS